MNLTRDLDLTSKNPYENIDLNDREGDLGSGDVSDDLERDDYDWP